ncbi:HAD family hydrolase [Streptomyces sp. NPDC002889]|uniref:HAD family hydrolase n=1 Tax=Streptomyces sp. NPDC002889 TaxID=3364669 RepID=UPI0036A7D095
MDRTSRAAVFDVDGTLVDSNHLHITAWWEAFRQAGHRVAMHDIHRAVGRPSSDLVAHLLGEDRDKDQDSDISAGHKALYGTFSDRLPAMEGARQLLLTLADSGWTVVLATSAGGAELSALRRAIGADEAIGATASADDVEKGKPAPDPIEHALVLAGVPAERAVFVGDTVWDMLAATRAHVRCVGLLCGGIPRSDLVEAGAAAVYDHPADLLARLDEGPFAEVARRADAD